MKKLILLFLVIPLFAFSQDYSDGFRAGYKEGYCYNDYGCIPPIPPVTPIANVGEYSYKHGYNRGFKMGIEAKKYKYESILGVSN